MHWDAIIAVAEIIGVIAIIASLIYVGVQVRQSTEFARAGIVNDTSTSWANASALLASDAELADIFVRGIENKSLTPVEALRLESLLDIYMANLENIEHQYRAGLYFDDDDDEDIVDYLAPLYKALLLSEVGRNWWENTAPISHTPHYYRKMNRIIEGWKAEKVE